MTNDFNSTQIRTFKRCAVYARFSTVMQRPASIEDQLRACTEQAREFGWEILGEHVYSDAAKSGITKVGRDGLSRLERAAEERPRPFDYVLFDDTSRLARDPADIWTFVKLMDFHGIKVCFVSQKLDSDHPSFELLLQVNSLVDSQYVSRLRKKVFSGQKGRVLNGYHVGSIPYGYRSVAIPDLDCPSAVGRAATKGNKLEIVPEQAEVVRRIFQWFVDGHSALSIGKRLNRDHIPSPQNSRKGISRSDWGPDPIKDILHNEKYIGWNVWNATTQMSTQLRARS